MNSDSLKNRLQLADETISILRSSNSQLDRNLSVLQSDFSVLESLLIESGQTLQKLQEMVRQTKISHTCEDDVYDRERIVLYTLVGSIRQHNSVIYYVEDLRIS